MSALARPGSVLQLGYAEKHPRTSPIADTAPPPTVKPQPTARRALGVDRGLFCTPDPSRFVLHRQKPLDHQGTPDHTLQMQFSGNPSASSVGAATILLRSGRKHWTPPRMALASRPDVHLRSDTARRPRKLVVGPCSTALRSWMTGSAAKESADLCLVARRRGICRRLANEPCHVEGGVERFKSREPTPPQPHRPGCGCGHRTTFLVERGFGGGRPSSWAWSTLRGPLSPHRRCSDRPSARAPDVLERAAGDRLRRSDAAARTRRDCRDREQGIDRAG